MPDFGLTKAISKAVRKGSKGARVLRPGEAEALAADARAAAAKQGQPPVTEPPAAVLTDEVTPAPKVDAAAPAAPRDPAAPSPTPDPQVLPKPGATAQQEVEANFARGERTAAEISGSKLDDFDLEATHQPNFDTMAGPDDVKAAIATLAEKNQARIEVARKGVIPDEEMAARGAAEVAQLARDLGMSTKRVSAALTPETVSATKQFIGFGARRLKDLADKWTAGNATDVEKLQFARTQQLMSAAIDQFMGARADWGRTGRVLRNPAELSSEAIASMRETFESIGAAKDMEALAKAISLTDSVGGVTKLAKNYGRSKTLGVLYEYFISNILSGPKTLIVNAMGTSIQLMNIIETGIAARARQGVKLTGQALLRAGKGTTAADRLATNMGRYLTAEEGVQVGEASALMHGTLSATRDAWRLAARAFRTGQTLDDVVKFETGAPGRVKQISAENLLPPEWRDTMFARFLDGLGSAVRVVPERGIAPTDEFFKTMAFRGEIERQAFLHVGKQLDAGKITLQDAETAAREFMENPPGSAVAAAEQFMKEMTFQNNLGPTGRAVQDVVNRTPGMTMIAPFIRTPINLFKQAHAKRSPLALFSAQFWRDVRAGGRARDLALTRVAMGSATTAMVANYVADGTITGGGPQDPDARKVWLETHQPYSIRVHNPITNETSYHSYARTEPIAFVIGATADACEIFAYLNSNTETLKDLRDEEAQGYDAAAAIIAGIANNTMSKTFMSGMANTTEMLSDPGRYIKQWSASYATALAVPWSGAVNTAAQISDPYLREAWTINDKLKSRIPGLSKDLPPSRDFFGDFRERARGDLLGVVSPMPAMTPGYDPVMSEIARVMQSSRQVPITMPNKNVDGMRLNAREYDKLVLLARTEPIFDGLTFKEQLDETMGSDTYLEATDTMKAEILRDVQNRADEVGRGMLETEDFAFAERIEEFRLKKARLRFGEEAE